MEKHTVRIAFYGKGGIGKSTIASNVSAALAGMGKKVLHIGCDPKADSTRCLTQSRIPSVLSQLEHLGEGVRRQDLLFEGIVPGVFCIEAGGPQAGRGCAGMGITAMETELERLEIFREDWDTVVYDVLGDVVCGGFSVPMRQHFADAVFVVSSPEYMSVYAANNILKAVEYYSSGSADLLGGMVWNHCRPGRDEAVMESYLRMTGVGNLCRIEESDLIRKSDFRGKLLIREFPESQAARAIQELAGYIAREGWRSSGERQTVFSPCTQEQLEEWRQRIAQLEAEE